MFRARALPLVAVLAATSLAYACGSNNDTPAPPGNVDASADSPNVDIDGGAQPDGSGQPDGSSTTTCGGQPCANYTGEKSFSDPSAPANASTLFGTVPKPNGTNPTNEPKIIYPSHETMFPINVSHIRHDWSKGGTNNLFRLHFVGPNTTVDIFTANANWEPSDEEWDWIAESNRGASVTLTVSGLNTASPGDVWQSGSITELFSDAEVEGAIYYWSTGTAGVMKALVSDRFPEKFYTDPAAADNGKCVACHTLSLDGKRLAVAYDGEKLREVNVPKREVLVPPPPSTTTRASTWTTFSPDGTKLLVASSGALKLINADTGAAIGANDGLVTLPNNQNATHPDWSALGDKVVVTLHPDDNARKVNEGSIAILPHSNDTFGAPQVIVQQTGNENNFAPAFSPDSKWIVFVRATGGSDNNETATLMLVPTAGGTPIPLTRVNRRVNNADNVIDIGNAMPRWAPSTKPGVFWLAFSSIRAYSIVRPQDDKKDQIWIAAIDPTKVAQDASYSAFWAPFQAIDQGNHRAFWTHTETDQQCRCVDICGDSLDNNCNGSADEQGCAQCGPVEICGNGIDDNCDCATDNCTAEEICGNGIDDDGDGLTDSADPSCKIN